eukprot:364904-Chlamydomonas_euryale.AAC.6
MQPDCQTMKATTHANSFQPPSNEGRNASKQPNAYTCTSYLADVFAKLTYREESWKPKIYNIEMQYRTYP